MLSKWVTGLDDTRVKVEFTILGDNFSPDDITKKLNVEPTLKWKIGEKINPQKHDRVYDCSGWEISTEYEKSMDINSQLKQIISKIKNSRDILADICGKSDVKSRFCIVIKIEKGNTPAMTLNRELIAFAYAINAEFDFDIYANPYSDAKENI